MNDVQTMCASVVHLPIRTVLTSRSSYVRKVRKAKPSTSSSRAEVESPSSPSPGDETRLVANGVDDAEDSSDRNDRSEVNDAGLSLSISGKSSEQSGRMPLRALTPPLFLAMAAGGGV